MKIIALLLIVAIALAGAAGVAAQGPAPGGQPSNPRPHEPQFVGDGSTDASEALRAEAAAAAGAEAIDPNWVLAFQSYLRASDNWDIYRARGNGSNQVRLTTNAAIDKDARLNPGSTRITFASDRDGDFELYYIKSSGPEGPNNPAIRLTNNDWDDQRPAYSPSGARIAFEAGSTTDTVDVYVINASGSGLTRLTSSPGFDGMPSWSPDGKKIVFSSQRSGDYRIWVMNADGSSPKQLSNQRSSFDPVYSPNGAKIAYDADNDGDGYEELWLMNADGSNQQMVYNPPQADRSVWTRTWSPDSQYVGFTEIACDPGCFNWTSASIFAWDSANPSQAPIRLSSFDTDWKPDWQKPFTLGSGPRLYLPHMRAAR